MQRRNDHGSVLLETVIAIPLLVLLVGGIMWIGQLMHDKQKLVVADRYVAWNAGNRHGGQWADVQQRFFETSTPDTASVLQPQRGDAKNWWHGVFAYVDLAVTMPSWTRGWLVDTYAATYATTAHERPPSNLRSFSGFHGRDLPPDGRRPGGHFVMTRSLGYTGTRNNLVNPEDEELSIKYVSVFYEKP